MLFLSNIQKIFADVNQLKTGFFQILQMNCNLSGQAICQDEK
jgi:hypothetical protein